MEIRRRLALWGLRIFLLMFVYLIIASLFDLNKIYVIPIFFLCMLLFNLSQLPYKFSKESLFAWIFFFSFLLVTFGGGTACILTFIFQYPMDSLILEISAVSFMLGVFLMIISGAARK